MIGTVVTLPNAANREILMALPVLRPLSLGEVLDVSFGLYRMMFAQLVLVAAAAQLIPIVLNVYIASSGGALDNMGLFLFYLAIAMVLSALGVAASTYIVSDAYLGRTTTATEAFARTAGKLGRLIMVSLLTSTLVGFGLILLIVPGIILLSGLLLGTVVAVLETQPSAVAAMGRSWELTSGYRGKVLLTLIVSFLLLVVPSVLIGTLWGLLGRAGVESVSMLVVQSLVSIFIYPFIYVVMTVIYYDLRVRKEGFDLELLAAALSPAG